MSWFSKRSYNELGEYLPDSEADLQQGEDTVKGKNMQEAKKECEELAAEYDAVSSDVEATDQQDIWKCKFKFWA
ncbi:MAG TPA: hypothetical protein VK184_08455 [Nostocaceae cyanobacterium]|nr:hypothetical protein [Nostocaceae cyanobacterium]